MLVFKLITLLLTFSMLSGCAAESNTPERSEHLEAVTDDVWFSMEEAQLRAQEDNKKVVIFVYTDWCGYCRRMDREVHSNSDVIDLYSEYYYPVRLNAESDKVIVFNGEEFTESQLAMAFGVTNYPTTVFLDESGNPFGSQPGFIKRDMFRDILVFVGTDAYKSQSFQDFLSR